MIPVMRSSGCRKMMWWSWKWKAWVSSTIPSCGKTATTPSSGKRKTDKHYDPRSETTFFPGPAELPASRHSPPSYLFCQYDRHGRAGEPEPFQFLQSVLHDSAD